MSKKPNDLAVSRRTFLKKGAAVGASATAVGVGAGALTGLSTQNATAQVPRWDREVDILVVGAGASGLPKRLNQGVHQDPIEAPIRETNAIVMMLVEGVHGLLQASAI